MKRARPALWVEAFTLVELLVAIGILAVLIALGFAASNKILAHAKSSQCTSNLRQIYMAAMGWSGDNNAKIVPVFHPDDPNNAISLQNWTGLLAPYLGRKKSDQFASADDLRVCVCPLRPKKFGYGYNYLYLSWSQGELNIFQWVTLPGMANPAKTVFITDSKNTNGVQGFNSWRAYIRSARVAKWLSDHIPAFDHEGKANVLWLDGHVTSEGEDSLFWKDDTLWTGK